MEVIFIITFRKNERRDYEHFEDTGRGKRPRKEREGGPPKTGGRGRGGDRGARGPKPTDAPTEEKPKEVVADQ